MSKTKVTSKIIDNIGTLIILLIIFVTVFYFIASFITKYTGFFVINPDKNFETCLKEKTILVYINSNAPEKTLENFETKDYLEYINIFNCIRNKEYCSNKKINYFPTWFIEGKTVYGDIKIEELAVIAGC
ncbi:MAG: hypothetical protein AABW90_03425 [Nanoarchaeota archaeon]